jgi:amino-acid N-acetyltransferase
MIIRSAKISDIKGICSLINSYAELDRMLFRSMADLYQDIQTFMVAEDAGKVIGCCSLQVVWSDLAEIKSLAVAMEYKNKGYGRLLVEKAVARAAELQVPRVFALTLEPAFFSKLGFQTVSTDTLPMKVWSDCASCPKQQNCDEIAMIKIV